MKEDAIVSAVRKRIIILDVAKVVDVYFFIEVEWIAN
jgi:hypothetical protein